MLDNNKAVEESDMENIIRNKRCQILSSNYAGISKNKKCFPATVYNTTAVLKALTSHMRGKIWY
jgi:hypothetical protein